MAGSSISARGGDRLLTVYGNTGDDWPATARPAVVTSSARLRLYAAGSRPISPTQSCTIRASAQGGEASTRLGNRKHSDLSPANFALASSASRGPLRELELDRTLHLLLQDGRSSRDPIPRGLTNMKAT